uniref:ABC transmembrane type-1 domain-containing protein n=1 Tax=Panagrolaimus sp. JU765 TaxID=591449 RepID=A0AC34RKY5_9BILA
MAHMITKSANQCKSAFDSKLSTFFFGVFSLIFAVAFNMNKNVPTAFLCSVCFGLQAITQYFVFRTSEVHLKITMMEKNERAKIDYEKIKNMSEKEIGRNLEDIADRHDQYLYFAHHRKSLVVSTQALKFAFVIAIPQITQAISYVMGCFLLVEGLVRPIVVYKVIQTLYMSSFSVSTIAQFNMDVRQARLGALNLNDVIGEGEDVESRRTTSISSQSSTE